MGKFSAVCSKTLSSGCSGVTNLFVCFLEYVCDLRTETMSHLLLSPQILPQWNKRKKKREWGKKGERKHLNEGEKRKRKREWEEEEIEEEKETF